MCHEQLRAVGVAPSLYPKSQFDDGFCYSLDAHAAATLIQRAWLAYAAKLQRMAVLIQYAYKGWKVRQRFRRWRTTALVAIVKMQSVMRGKRARILVAHMRKKYMVQCALRIQTAWRGARYVLRRSEGALRGC